MCGRYDFFPGEFTDLRIRFNLPKDLPLFKPGFNIALASCQLAPSHEF
jgi:hypothetical protein